MIISSRIEKLASKKDMDLSEVEKQNDLERNSISKWEYKVPSADELNKIAYFFDVSPDYLMGNTDLPRFIIDDAEREKSIEEALDSVFVYGGGEMSENDRDVIRRHLEVYLRSEK